MYINVEVELLLEAISTNLEICNFLDVTLNLTDGTYYPYRKPNNETLYIDRNSNHPLTIIKHLPAASSRHANVTTESDTTGKNYIGLTEGTFKQRYTQHKLSFRNRNYSNSTELSKHIWTLKDNNTNFTINWSILATAPAYSYKSKRCHLCLTEKLYLIRAKKPSLLKKRSELISKCRHENKFYLANFKSRQQ